MPDFMNPTEQPLAYVFSQSDVMVPGETKTQRHTANLLAKLVSSARREGADAGTWISCATAAQHLRPQLHPDHAPLVDIFLAGLKQLALGGPVVELVTAAPKAFDGFGTFTTAEQDTAKGDIPGGRRVRVYREHLDWQTKRYGSGLYPWKAV